MPMKIADESFVDNFAININYCDSTENIPLPEKSQTFSMSFLE